MKLYMLAFGADNATSGPVEVALPTGTAKKNAEIGDLVLGIFTVTGVDVSDSFASVVTQSAFGPGPVLIQSGGNFSGVRTVALMQRGDLQT